MRHLQFYVSHWQEMEEFYNTDESPIGINYENREDLIQKIDDVGDAACSEASQLLFKIIEGVSNHFKAKGFNVEIRNRKSTVEEGWGIEAFIYPKRTRNKIDFRVGVNITIRDEGECVLIPWLYRKGGKRIEKDLLTALGKPFQEKPSSWIHHGTVCLPPVNLIGENGIINDEDLTRKIITAFSEVDEPAYTTAYNL